MVHLSLLLTVYSPGYSKRAVRSGAQGRNIDKELKQIPGEEHCLLSGLLMNFLF